MVPRF
jgi:hypothetical protein